MHSFLSLYLSFFRSFSSSLCPFIRISFNFSVNEFVFKSFQLYFRLYLCFFADKSFCFGFCLCLCLCFCFSFFLFVFLPPSCGHTRTLRKQTLQHILFLRGGLANLKVSFFFCFNLLFRFGGLSIDQFKSYCSLLTVLNYLLLKVY